MHGGKNLLARLLEEPRPEWARYGVALLALAGAAGARAALSVLWTSERPYPYLVFFPAVMFAAYYGGFGPGLLATVGATVLAAYFWIPPHGALFISHPADIAAVGAFAASGALISGLAERLKSTRAREAAAREASEKAKSEAEAMRAAREDLMAIVAHDLRNPLHSILLTCGTMKLAHADAASTKRIEAIERAVQGMNALIRDLLDVSTIEGGSLVLELRQEAVAALVSDAVEAITPLAHDKNVSVDVELGNTPTVGCDRDRVLQVLANLLGNAVKFTPRGGRIVLRTTSQDDCVRFEVEDNGAGIEKEALPHVFERHWRGRDGGTGLGLYIASGVVRAHGGRMWLTSERGLGTSVFFTVPSTASGTRTIMASGRYPRAS